MSEEVQEENPDPSAEENNEPTTSGDSSLTNISDGEANPKIGELPPEDEDKKNLAVSLKRFIRTLDPKNQIRWTIARAYQLELRQKQKRAEGEEEIEEIKAKLKPRTRKEWEAVIDALFPKKKEKEEEAEEKEKQEVTE